MMRSRAEPVIAAALVALGGGCIEAGQPWGLVRATLEVGFEPEASRFDGERLITARDYRLAIDTVELDLDGLSITTRGTSAVFDPARPPIGYTLCHNGHCHSEDGRLVPYDEIGGGEDGELLASLGGGRVVLALGDRGEVVLSGCPARGCEVLEPVRLGALTVALASLRVTGRAFDARTESRLPPEGVAFELAAPALTATAALDAGFGPDQRLGLALDGVLALPASLFDDVDFATIPVDVAERLRVRLGEDTHLTVEASRFD